jgi:ubiquinone/menaquinone biosynthesis C-methylase UbiE
VGKIFLEWLDPPRSLHRLDVGCGNGAFTEENPYAEALPFGNGSFDIAIMALVISFVSDAGRVPNQNWDEPTKLT